MTNKKITDDLSNQLIDAAALGDAFACQHLLEHGVNIHVTDSNGWNALHWAAWNGRSDTCQRLIEYGANVCVVDKDGSSALHMVALNGYTDICLMLLAHDSDPNAKDNYNQTAREVAIEAGHEGCAHAMDAWVGAQAARVALQEIAAADVMKVIAP